MVLIPKGADPTLVKNYRPITILPTVSKILEKHVKTLIEDHLRLHAPILPRQGGFMSTHSTVSALIQVIEDWSRAIEHGYEICVVFFDVQKAFDSVPHFTLLKHLQSLHIHTFVLNWVKSYLLDREQFVGIDGSNCNSLQVFQVFPKVQF